VACKLPPYGEARDGRQRDADTGFRIKEEFGMEIEEVKGKEL
jgi:hypothetical protein